MRKLSNNRIGIAVLALLMITCCIYRVLLTHASSLPNDCGITSIEPLKKGETLWESLSYHFVSWAGY